MNQLFFSNPNSLLIEKKEDEKASVKYKFKTWIKNN